MLPLLTSQSESASGAWWITCCKGFDGRRWRGYPVDAVLIQAHPEVEALFRVHAVGGDFATFIGGACASAGAVGTRLAGTEGLGVASPCRGSKRATRI